MIFRRILALGFLAFLVFGLLGMVGMAGRARSESAWRQGYLAGQQAAASEDGAPPSQPFIGSEAYGYGRYHPHFHSHSGFFPGLGFFACLIPLFFLGIFFFLVGPRRRRWRHGPWHHGPGRYSPHKPPWVDDNDLADEPVMKA